MWLNISEILICGIDVKCIVIRRSCSYSLLNNTMNDESTKCSDEVVGTSESV